jgi:hypothetical protein
VRQHRERRRNGLRLMTVQMPEHAISRGLLKPEESGQAMGRDPGLLCLLAVGRGNAVAYPERGRKKTHPLKKPTPTPEGAVRPRLWHRLFRLVRRLPRPRQTAKL